MKLFINPSFTNPDKGDGGIRRVIEAMVKYLPDHGIEIVDSPEEADILNYHAGNYTEYQNKPMIASCHGLYWSNYKWADYYYPANQNVIEVMARAQAVTVPSEWVKTAVTRGILHNPTVIYHGVDLDFWKPIKRPAADYVLWNKARADIISNPEDLDKTAAVMPNVKFLTTIGTPAPNVKICGVVPYPEMVSIIKNAGVYLATARETMGIGTLEAIAAGVPVAGWDHGGQSEIVIEGLTGYLAPYGDYQALAECIQKCINERPRMSINARKNAIAKWGWEDKIAQYADLFYKTLNQGIPNSPYDYTVVIPAHNLGHYLQKALDSVKAQTADNVECIIIDDYSTDNTAEIAAGNQWAKYHKTDQNIGLCNVRNLGASMANGRYLIFLDADDMLHPKAIETLAAHLDSHPGTHLAYGRIDFMNEAGTGYKEGSNPAPYNWMNQIAHIHQFPIGACLMRTDVIKRSGGV